MRIFAANFRRLKEVDYIKRIKKVKMAAAQASIAVPSCRKICCPNGSRKLLTQKIFIRPYQSFVAEGIFRTKCDFLQVLDLLIFRIERRAIEAQRLQSIFT